jgi:hypothetical protein
MGDPRQLAGAFVLIGCLAACSADESPQQSTNPSGVAGAAAASGSAGSTPAAVGGAGASTGAAGMRSTPIVTPPSMAAGKPAVAGTSAAGSPAAGSPAAGGPSAGAPAAVTAGTSATPPMPMAGGAATPPDPGSMEPKIPEAKGECQPFKTGDMTFAGSRVRVFAGEKKSKTGPLIFYWYATGSSVAEVNQGIPQAAISEITGMGGIITAMYQTTSKGQNTGNGVWYAGDFDVSDQIVACAVKVHDIDTHHIHALGWSAGGLQSGYMAYQRSNYMASVAPYSGGSLNRMLQDPSNVPSAMLFHGAPGVDVVILDFSQSSDQMGMDIKMKGGFALNCNHGGAHMIPGPPGPAAAWLFFKAHGYKTKPSPWATMIPTGVPSYCKPY